MPVVDASVVVLALGDPGALGDEARRRLVSGPLAAPELLDVECLSALRGLTLGRILDGATATAAIRNLHELPIVRHRHPPLVMRCWSLRDNLTPYDAAYVALAELLDLPLLTADARLARAPGLRCPIEVLGA